MPTALLALLLTAIFTYIFYAIICYAADIASPLRRFARKNNLTDYNDLYLCDYDECGKPFRLYQSLLIKASEDSESESYLGRTRYCPHCKRLAFPKHIDEEVKQLDYHMECPKLFSAKERRKMKTTIEQIRQHHEDIKVEEKYGKYITEKPDLSWIDNVQEFATRSRNRQKQQDLEKTLEDLKERHIRSGL